VLRFAYDRPYYLQFRITRASDAATESTHEGYGRPARLVEIKADTIIDVVVDGFVDRIVRQSTASPRVTRVRGVRLPSLGRTRDVLVYLPASYARSSHRYPVTYLLDGDVMFDRATTSDGEEWRVDETLDSLARAGRGEQIVVAIETGGLRVREYLPYPVSDATRAAEGAAFARDIAEGIVPAIDARFRTRPRARDRAIGGSSMGTLIALYTTLHFPRVFGAAAVLSPPWWGGLPYDSLFADLEVRAPTLGHRFALYRGGREGGPEWQATVDRIGAALRRSPRNTVTVESESLGIHAPVAWRGPIARFLAERGTRPSPGRRAGSEGQP
jgi:predicted alpha/beta superfamily hydrolase